MWWDADPEHRDDWLAIFAVMWVAFLAGTDVARVCDGIQRHLFGWERVTVVQFTVPVAAWAGWRAGRLLAGCAGPPPVVPGRSPAGGP
jgi:hypothetical protein